MNPPYSRLALSFLSTLLLVITACSSWQDPTVDLPDREKSSLEELKLVDEQLMAIAALKPRQQLDSLLVWTVLLKNHAEESALEYAREATRIATATNQREYQAIGLYYLALLEGRQQLYREGLADPLFNARASQRIWEQEQNPDWLANIYYLLGEVFYRQNQYDSSYYYYTASWDQLALAQHSQASVESLRGSILQGRGLIAFENEDYLLADSFYHQAAAHYQIAEDENAMFSLRHAQALVFPELGLRDSALVLLQQTLQATRERENLYMQVVTLQMLGEYYLEEYRAKQREDDYQLSESYFRESLSYQTDNFFYTYRRLGYLMQRRAINNLDELYYVDSALINYNKALVYATSEGALDYFRSLSKSITDLCEWLKEAQGRECAEIIGARPSNFLFTNYSQVVDTITTDLISANTNFQQFERQQQQLESRIRVRNIWMITGGGLALALFTFLFLYQNQKQKRLQARMEALRAQINPHFFSNSLNAIESLVNLDQRKAASKYLIHFSRLTRRVLNSSMESSTTLSGELETTRHFLALEQLRFKDKLHYEIVVEPNLEPNQIEVPSLIFQPYLENAIWHGIKPKDEPSLLQIIISKEGDELHCLIEDNGIGRAAAEKQKEKTVLQRKSVGMKITKERLLSFGGGTVHIKDLYEEDGTASGTRVLLRLPYKMYKK